MAGKTSAELVSGFMNSSLFDTFSQTNFYDEQLSAEQTHRAYFDNVDQLKNWGDKLLEQGRGVGSQPPSVADANGNKSQVFTNAELDAIPWGKPKSQVAAEHNRIGLVRDQVKAWTDPNFEGQGHFEDWRTNVTLTEVEKNFLKANEPNSLMTPAEKEAANKAFTEWAQPRDDEYAAYENVSNKLEVAKSANIQMGAEAYAKAEFIGSVREFQSNINYGANSEDRPALYEGMATRAFDYISSNNNLSTAFADYRDNHDMDKLNAALAQSGLSGDDLVLVTNAMDMVDKSYDSDFMKNHINEKMNDSTMPSYMKDNVASLSAFSASEEPTTTEPTTTEPTSTTPVINNDEEKPAYDPYKDLRDRPEVKGILDAAGQKAMLQGLIDQRNRDIAIELMNGNLSRDVLHNYGYTDELLDAETAKVNKELEAYLDSKVDPHAGTSGASARATYKEQWLNDKCDAIEDRLAGEVISGKTSFEALDAAGFKEIHGHIDLAIDERNKEQEAAVEVTNPDVTATPADDVATEAPTATTDAPDMTGNLDETVRPDPYADLKAHKDQFTAEQYASLERQINEEMAMKIHTGEFGAGMTSEERKKALEEAGYAYKTENGTGVQDLLNEMYETKPLATAYDQSTKLNAPPSYENMGYTSGDLQLLKIKALEDVAWSKTNSKNETKYMTGTDLIKSQYEALSTGFGNAFGTFEDFTKALDGKYADLNAEQQGFLTALLPAIDANIEHNDHIRKDVEKSVARRLMEADLPDASDSATEAERQAGE